jgi:pimeloyl-ACP methyl ester carboxylesterase
VALGSGSRTFLAYRDWLESELERIDEPNLVAHAWGGGHVVNAVMHRPELVCSWASDAVGLFDPDQVWHDLAQLRQMPGDGNGWPRRCWDGGSGARRHGL